MATSPKTQITVSTRIDATLDWVWKCWTDPRHIIYWNQANSEWHTPRAVNDLRPGGRFTSRMETRDGSMGFDFAGTYREVKAGEYIAYELDDGRRVQITFKPGKELIHIEETFEIEDTNGMDLQQKGWQSILDNFKHYVESRRKFERLHFDIRIDAPVERVYTRMLQPETFSKWTAVFNPKSKLEGNWKKGTHMRFIGEDSDGREGGTLAIVREHIPNRFISMQHVALLKEGKEITSGREAESWIGAFENYSFREEARGTRLSVDADSNAGFFDFFKQTWPAALEKLKILCEEDQI